MRALQDPDRPTELGGDRRLDGCGPIRRVRCRPEHHVAALDVRRDRFVAELLVQRSQPRHRDLVVAAHVDPAEQ